MRLTNIEKYNIKTVSLSIIVLIVLLSVFTFIQAPSTEYFEWSSVNPLEGIAGIIFALSFGFGVPVAISIICLLVVLFMMWFCLLLLVRKIIK